MQLCLANKVMLNVSGRLSRSRAAVSLFSLLSSQEGSVITFRLISDILFSSIFCVLVKLKCLGSTNARHTAQTPNITLGRIKYWETGIQNKTVCLRLLKYR